MNSNVLKVQFTLFQDLTLVVVRVNWNFLDKINGVTVQLACVAGILRGRGRGRNQFGCTRTRRACSSHSRAPELNFPSSP